MRKPDLERNKLIYNLFFEDKLTASEISKKVNLSISQITRVLSNFPLYEQEKTKRKEENHIKHIEQTKEIMRNKRNKQQLEEKEIMDKLHYQASIELSYFSPISKVNLIKSCSSAYSYNPNTKTHELKNDMVYSADMPTKIKY